MNEFDKIVLAALAGSTVLAMMATVFVITVLL